MNEQEWEEIIVEKYASLSRTPVPGGWLYRNTELSDGDSEIACAMVFVPDPPSVQNSDKVDDEDKGCFTCRYHMEDCHKKVGPCDLYSKWEAKP